MAETVILTASAGSFPGLVQVLKETEAAVQEHPLISFTAPAEWAPLDQALERVRSYGAVALTSPRAAAAVAGRMKLRAGAAAPTQAGPPIWVGGRATAAALGDALGPVRMPSEEGGGTGVASTLARAMLEAETSGTVLFPCGDARREELPDTLRDHGIQVDEVICYRTILASEAVARAAALRGTVMVVASPSVAGLLVHACPPGSRPDLLAVGPTTAAAARESGWAPAAVAASPTAAAVAAALRDLIARRSFGE